MSDSKKLETIRKKVKELRLTMAELAKRVGEGNPNGMASGGAIGGFGVDDPRKMPPHLFNNALRISPIKITLLVFAPNAGP